MIDDFDRVSEFFKAWTQRNGSAGPIGEVAQWLAGGGFAPEGFAAIVDDHGVRRESWFRSGVLDLILEYAAERLSRGGMTIDHVADVRFLNMALHVEEGEFALHRPAEVSALIQEQVDQFLSDQHLSGDEELHLVGLQAAFDLSYDDFLKLARPALERAASEFASNTPVEGESRLAEFRASLAPLYWLAMHQHRSLGALF